MIGLRKEKNDELISFEIQTFVSPFERIGVLANGKVVNLTSAYGA